MPISNEKRSEKRRLESARAAGDKVYSARPEDLDVRAAMAAKNTRVDHRPALRIIEAAFRSTEATSERVTGWCGRVGSG